MIYNLSVCWGYTVDFGGGLEVLGVEIFGRRGFSGFLEMGGIWGCERSVG